MRIVPTIGDSFKVNFNFNLLLERKSSLNFSSYRDLLIANTTETEFKQVLEGKALIRSRKDLQDNNNFSLKAFANKPKDLKLNA